MTQRDFEQLLAMDRAIVDAIHYRRPISLFTANARATYNERAKY